MNMGLWFVDTVRIAEIARRDMPRRTARRGPGAHGKNAGMQHGNLVQCVEPHRESIG